jgi:hypothetical protein
MMTVLVAAKPGYQPEWEEAHRLFDEAHRSGRTLAVNLRNNLRAEIRVLGGVHVTAGDVALIMKEPSVEMALAGTAIKVLPTVASGLVVKSIPFVGWA